MSEARVDTDSPSAIARDVVGHARALAAAGRWKEAIDAATRANRQRRDPALEYMLVRWRHRAAAAMAAAAAPQVPTYPDLFADADGLPEIPASQLTAAAIGSAIQRHGCLIVRGLLQAEEAHRLSQGIDCAIDAADTAADGTPAVRTLPWFAPLLTEHDNRGLARMRWITRRSGSLLTADSPRMLFDLLEVFERGRVIDVIEQHLGERPTLSAQKAVLRRAQPSSASDWHQDGAFLGRDIRPVNVWLALSDCGEDAAGLDIVARRLEGIVETGTRGARFEWSVGPDMLEQLAPESAVVSPRFAAGDAAVFDHLCLHRTGYRPGMTKKRWAIESWFFAPSSQPNRYFPLVV
ncbi:MAG: phytanoyl-CoA dioxygenase family protein [Vicinamibacterales bacterium]